MLKSPTRGWAVAKELLNFWPKSQAEALAAELPIKKRICSAYTGYSLSLLETDCRVINNNKFKTVIQS